MTAPATKTRALCVATRCTSVDQFVATFHRFYGDDQSFFVATMTTRPVGLETPFSIQLADRQPVLRGLCIVLDVWDTPENRYNRPGIRLGIKRLTAESQAVFDRLRAASKAPVAIAEATPAPDPPPEPTLSARGSSPSQAPSPSTAPPSSLPPPVPGVPRPPAVAPRASAMPPPLPLPPRLDQPLPRAATPPPLPPAPTLSTVPGLPPVIPSIPRPLPATAPQPPAPVAVTRFQVALNVASIPPPVDDVEFKPTQLIPRYRVEPRIVSDPAPGEAPVDQASAALIVDRPSGARDTLPSFPSIDVAAAGPDPDLAHTDAAPAPARHAPSSGPAAIGLRTPAMRPAPAVNLRTPGSALVLPANPLYDLSDESLEGFIDCTLYEEGDNVFHPESDDRGSDEAADPPASSPATRDSPLAAVPAMPFDAAPDVIVRLIGDTESLAVGPALETQHAGDAAPPRLGLASDSPFVPPDTASTSEASDGRWGPDGSAGGAGRSPVPSSAAWHHPASAPYGMDPGAYPPPPDGALGPIDLATAVQFPGYGNTGQVPLVHATFDAAGYPAPAGYRDDRVSHVVFRQPAPRRTVEWRRWLLITGTAVASIVLAFMIARQVRGPEPSVATGPDGSQAPDVRPVDVVAPRAAPASDPPAAPLPTPARATATAPGGGSSAPTDVISIDDDGDAVARGTAVAGSGPCRLTVATTPDGSLVRLDDRAIGSSPITIDASCDKHKLEISHARYQSATRWIALAAEKPQQLEISLPRPIHAVTVTSFPPGAELSIDGRRAGITPTVVQMMGFATAKLTFTKAGFQSVTTKVYSKLAEDRVFVKLTK